MEDIKEDKMAERRMFAKKITESDAFLDMPMSTQALYFHLNMSADDDGFVNNPKKIQRMVGASDDDLKLLKLKSFIITFDSGIIVIKHWKMHNYIQSDRYKPTDYVEEKSMLDLKKNKSYTLNGNAMDTECIQDVSVGKVRVGKDRVGKVSIDKDNIKDKKTLAVAQTYFPNDEKLNQTFIDFIKMRKTIKNGAMTERAITMMINKLSKYDNDTAIEMLNRSIINNWKDVYELKDTSRNNKPGKQSMSDFQSEAKEWLNEREGVSSDFFGD